MKNIILAMALVISSLTIAKAQTDPCTGIKKTHDDELAKTEYRTTLFSNIAITRSRKDGGRYDNLSIFFSAVSKKADYHAVGLFVTFADGTIWKDLSADIICSFRNIDVGYDFAASYLFDDRSQFTPFKTKKIVKIRISDIEIPIDDAFATKFIAWANCIETLK